MNRKKKGGK